jgi:tRNA (adenine57-N1/adenine58-N1)-methyltransferase
MAQAGDVVQLVPRDKKKTFIFQLMPGQRLHTHRGLFNHDDLIGRDFGVEVHSHLGHPFYLLQPSIDDLIRDLERTSQIMYPKDIGLVLLKLSVHAGVTVLEAGTGSGGLTTVLAQMVGPGGRVVSYDVRADMQNLARKNLQRLGLSDRVTLKLRDIALGFDETEVEALFLDVPNPWDYVGPAHRALQGGGFFGSLLPTTNQVSDLLIAMRREGFEFIEVCEVLLRYYKPVPERLRPADRMVAHTGFLVFGRKIFRATPDDAPPQIDEALDSELSEDEQASG